MKLIIGLGNPGRRYEGSRHNLGFMAVEALARNFQIDKKSNSEILKTKIDKQNIVLAKPKTFMNASGQAVKSLITRYSISDYSNIWVVHDEIDLALGKMKIKFGGGAAGHRGVLSIMEWLGSGDFVRFRLGIGHPYPRTRQSVDDYVMKKFSLEEKEAVRQLIEKAGEAIKLALGRGWETAMNRFNE